MIEPYSKNRFVRFHSFQSLFFAAALLVLHFGFRTFWFMPFMGFITLPLRLLVDLGAFVIWIILLIKASQGIMYKLPVIGDMAEKQANVF